MHILEGALLAWSSAFGHPVPANRGGGKVTVFARRVPIVGPVCTALRVILPMGGAGGSPRID
jgi:hypothetical protein